MSGAPRAAPEVGFRIQGLALRKVTVERLGGLPGEAAAEPTIEFGLGVERPSADEIGIELKVSVAHEGVLAAEVSYAGRFKRLEGAAEPPGEEDVRFFAAKVAPSVLYPFIRETLASLVVKTGLPPLMLPVINFGAVFDPRDIQVPAPPTDSTPAGPGPGRSA